MVRWNKVNIPLGQGIDSKTDSKSLPMGKLEVLENGVFTNKIAIKKRNGYSALSTDVLNGATVTNCSSICTRSNELISFDGAKTFSYTESIDKWVDKGDLLSLGQEQRTVAATPFEQSIADYASTDGITCYIWKDSTGIKVSIEDSTGNLLVHNALVSATGTRPRAIAFGGHIHLLFVETSSNSLMNLKINAFNPITDVGGAAITVINDFNGTTPNYDVKPYGEVAVFAYHSTAGTLKVGYIAHNGVAGSPGNGGHPSVTSHAYIPDGCIAVHSNSVFGYVFIAFVEDTVGVSVMSVTSDLLTNGAYTTSPLDISENSTDFTATNITLVPQQQAGLLPEVLDVYFEVPNATSWKHYTRCVGLTISGLGGNLTSLGTTHTWKHVGLGSHAFTDTDNINHSFVNLVHDSAEQSTYFTVRDDGKVVGRHLSGFAGGNVEGGTLPSVYSSARVHTFVSIFKNRLEVDTGVAGTFAEKGIKRVDLNFDSPQAFKQNQIGSSIYITGGYLSMYDGYSPVESGFHLYPENVTATPGVSGGGGMNSNTSYQYQVHWEWFNSNGERELSTAQAITVTMGGSDNQVVLVVPTLSMTEKTAPKRNEIRLAITRTTANGTTRYRADDPLSPTWNDTAAETVTFTDTLSDAVLATRELDYTNAEFVHVSPPSAEIIAGTKDRLFLAGFDNPNLIRYSKLHTWGDAISFNDGLQILVDQKGGNITALAPLDDKVVVFKENRIFVFTGDGPSNTGLAGGGFSAPQLVTSDAGCSNQKSIVDTPLGLMFQSNKGIYLLDRSLQLKYIGADVEAFNKQTITSAELLSDRNLIIFLCSSGKTLVYDYFFGQWSTYTNHIGVGATLWNGTYTYSKSNGETLKEVEGFYKDIGTSIKLRIETGWITFDGLSSFARVRRAYITGNYVSSHILKTKIAYDYNPFFSNTITWDPSTVLNTDTYGVETAIGDTGVYGGGTGVYGGSGTSVYQHLIQMPRQKCEAVKFRFEDVINSDTYGGSFILNQLTLELGMKSTPFKGLGADSTVG